MSHKKMPHWLVVRYDEDPPVFLCSHCGATRIIYLPAPCSDFIKQAEAFLESHKYCEVKK